MRPSLVEIIRKELERREWRCPNWIGRQVLDGKPAGMSIMCGHGRLLNSGGRTFRLHRTGVFRRITDRMAALQIGRSGFGAKDRVWSPENGRKRSGSSMSMNCSEPTI